MSMTPLSKNFTIPLGDIPYPKGSFFTAIKGFVKAWFPKIGTCYDFRINYIHSTRQIPEITKKTSSSRGEGRWTPNTRSLPIFVQESKTK